MTAAPCAHPLLSCVVDTSELSPGCPTCGGVEGRVLFRCKLCGAQFVRDLDDYASHEIVVLNSRA